MDVIPEYCEALADDREYKEVRVLAGKRLGMSFLDPKRLEMTRHRSVYMIVQVSTEDVDVQIFSGKCLDVHISV